MRLYNGRYVGTCSLESLQQFIFLSLPTLFLCLFLSLQLPHSFSCAKQNCTERKSVSFFCEQQWSFLLQNGFSMFVSFCCFLCSLFIMKLWLHHRSLSLGISLFFVFFKVFFVSRICFVWSRIVLFFVFSYIVLFFLKQQKN